MIRRVLIRLIRAALADAEVQQELRRAVAAAQTELKTSYSGTLR